MHILDTQIMNRFNLLFAIGFFSLLSIQSAAQCTAEFIYDPVDLTVNFTDQSFSNDGSPIISWAWSFGDGNTSTQQNPSHTYGSADDYNVCLTITTANGCSNSICYEVEICELVMSVNVGTNCSANNEVQVTVNITDPYDAAREINVLLDGVLVPGSPFDIDDVNPVNLTLNVPGDGLNHTIEAQSTRVGTCTASFTFTTTDCTSGCFLSGLFIEYAASSTFVVEVRDNFFSPTTTTINAGDIVEFRWIDGGHTSTSDATSGNDSWNSGEHGAGFVYPVTIDNPGTHPYYCIPHGGPGGSGMSGTIIANCPPGNNFTININFNTTVANSQGFNLIIDGVLDPASPYPYTGTGLNTVTTTIAGDGQTHSITIEDVNDPTCTISTNFIAPDCGIAPMCSISLSAAEVGGCNTNNEVPVDVTVTSINGGTAGFNLFVDGTLVSGSPYPYNGGNTIVTINVPGDGQSHTILAEDVLDNACTGSTTITTTNCTIPCSLTNLNLSTGNPITHTVEVQDFQFSPTSININVNDNVNFIWTGAVPHSTTSDATSGPDSWDSGVIGQGSSFQVTINNAGLHPYYCIPHGAPGGTGMAGTITATAACNNGNVTVAVAFSETGGSFNGFNVLVDGTITPGSPYPYDPSGSNQVAIEVPGDGQSHTIQVVDFDDQSCTISGSITTPDCSAPTCQLTATATQVGGCNGTNVTYDLQVNDTGGGASGFNVFVDGTITPGSPYPYSGTGTTNVNITIIGDGQSHTIDVEDIDDSTCTASVTVTPPDCTIPCSLTNLNLSTGNPITHTVEVQDFQFSPTSININVNDNVNFIWTGAVPHSTTSDATSGPDSWDSGVIGQGSSFQVTINNAGLHPYYCIPHGAPGGTGMAGTITATAACNNGNVTVAVAFSETGGSFNGFNVLVDGTITPGSPYPYDPSGSNQVAVEVPGDGQSHTIQVVDFDDQSCTISGSITTPDCSAPTCQLTATATQLGGCNGTNVTYDLQVNDTGGGASGFNVFVDGTITPGSPYPYSGTGTTNVNITIIGDGQSHTIDVEDIDDSTCTASVTVTPPDCTIPCSLTNLNLSTGNPITHTVEVQDFQFSPTSININVNDNVNFIWTGAVPHSTTSDATSGPDSWDSGVIGQGSSFQVTINNAGLHPYYCIPHGAPGGTGMAGTITATAACNNGNVTVAVAFSETGGSFNGFNVLVDGTITPGSPYPYDPSGSNQVAVEVPGDGQSHTIQVVDFDDQSCTISGSITTPDCSAPTCQLTATATQLGGCNGTNVTYDLQVNDTGGGASGFNVFVDGTITPGSPYPYSGTGTTNVNITIIGDGQSHTIDVEDIDDSTCTASVTVTPPDCTIPCSLTNLNLSTGNPITHTVEVQDFQFSPTSININVNDNVNFIWTGAVPHSTTSDATSGPDSWDSGVIGQGSSFQVTINNAGLHPYYCIPHGAPGGTGMAGTITATAACNNGNVTVAVAFSETGGSFNGFNVLVDGTITPGSPYPYDPSGSNQVAVEVPGDGQSHTIQVVDFDDQSCTISGSITTPDCSAPTCQLTATATQVGGCNGTNVTYDLQVNDTGGGASGFNVFVDGTITPGSPYPYSGTGTTNVNITIIGDGQSHTIDVEDIDDSTCTASVTVTPPDCTIPCSLTNLNLSTGNPITHTVEVQDFQFSPTSININVNDNVNFIWTGAVPHSTTSDATSGPDSWDSGVIGQGSSFQVTINNAGLHPYYCIPHGAPGGTGMAGTITATAACNNGNVTVAVAFSETGGSFNGFNVLVDGTITPGSPYPYDPSGSNQVAVEVPGDGQSHTIQVVDFDDQSCTISGSITTPDCSAPTCQLTATATQIGGCNGTNVTYDLQVNDTGGGASGFNVFVDGTITPGSPYPYSGTGTTNVNITIIGDGQSHTIDVEDIDDSTCTASVTVTPPDCTIPCSLTNLNLSTGNPITHTVEVQDFQFSPTSININVNDNVNFIWTGAVPHSTTSDATSGPDSWDSGVIGQGSSFQVTINNAGLHPYYCIPHGAPGGTGMAGTITATAACNNGNVTVAVAFSETGGSFNGFNVLVDGTITPGSPYPYDPSGSNQVAIEVPGDGQSHTIQVVDFDDQSCTISGSITTPDCSAPTCQLTATATQVGGCNGTNVTYDLQVNDTGGGASGFNVFVDGTITPGSPYPYSGTGTTNVNITIIGDGQSHTIDVEDIDDSTCTAALDVDVPDCSAPCLIKNLSISSGDPVTHIIEVQDFQFTPNSLTIGVGDTVEFVWTGVVAHTATSDATSGLDSWDSDLLGQGATYRVVLNTIGDHPYYCIPHGAPGGIGMAGMISVVPDCNAGEVSVQVSFEASGGSFEGFNVFVDSVITNNSPYSYDPSGFNSISVQLPGDSMYHQLIIQDVIEPSCEAIDSILTPNCGCSLAVNLTQSTNCNAGDSVTIEAAISGNNISNADYHVILDDLLIADSVAYDSVMPSIYHLSIPGDGLSHVIEIIDATDSTCIAMDTIIVSNCISPCFLENLQLTSGGTATTHIVEVQDFQFEPKDISISVGDIIRFDWTGVIPHTSTSDATSGPDVWDSGLLQQGDIYEVTIQEEGLHPYYCIPHGTPGGVGMAGTISAAPACDNGMVNTTISFEAINGSSLGYNVYIDGILLTGSPFTYAGNGPNMLDIQLPGDGATHLVQIQDAEDMACSIEESIITADCGFTNPCSLDLLADRTSNCLPGSGEVEVQLTISSSNTGTNGYHLLLDGNQISGGPFNYDPSGTTVQTILVAGTGTNRSIEVVDVDDPSCSASANVNTPQCGVLCEVQDLQIHINEPITHRVEVRDFEFVPAILDVVVGDSVQFVWTGAIPHTATSDASSGSNSWDSGLLGQGATFTIVINEEGAHPYYCIPHGGPGGIGMAAMINAKPHCDGDRANVNISFNITNGSSLGYNVFIDGSLVDGSPFQYTDRTGFNTQLINIAGDSSNHSLTIQDLDINFCAATINFLSPECLPTCLITGLSASSGSDIIHRVAVRDFDFFPAIIDVGVGETIRFEWTGDVPHTTTSDALNGADSWDSGLLGIGATYDITIQQAGQHRYYCIPHGGPGGIGMAGIINAQEDCDNGMVNLAIQFSISNGSPNGYNAFIDGNLVTGSPFSYDDPMGTNELIISVPGDGITHVLTVQDLETSFCAASIQFTPNNCTPEPCSITDAQLEFSNTINHIIEVQDFVFAPQQLNITLGDTVTFLWTGVVAHTTTSDATTGTDSWDSGLLGQGASYSVVPTQLGAHPYYCIPHGAPGGVGMAGTINVVPPCDNGNVNGLLTFQSGGGNASQYNVLIDGQTYAGSPFDYTANGNNSLLLTLAGDGLTHSISIVDVDDPACSQELNVELPDCTPVCELTLTTSAGDCDGNNEIPIQLTIQSANTTSNGFNLLVDGSPAAGSPYPYDGSGTTTITIHLEGDGLSHDFSITDLNDSDCTASATLSLVDCTPEPCSITDAQLEFSNTINHIIEVQDFVFAPQQLNITLGDTVTFLWTGVVAHTTTSDATTGTDSWDSGLLGQGASYSVVPTQLGAHPYYCIPHGAPGGVGMAGTINVVPPCDNGNVNGLLTFQSGGGNASQYNVLIDGQTYAGSPFDYAANGNNSLLLTLAGDGLTHSISIVDVDDPACSQELNVELPDCTPVCELTLTTSAGDCDGNNEIPIQLTIQSANTTSNGFNLLVDGSPAAGSPYPYDGSGTTTITIHLEGDGLSHDFSITDLNDSDCTASATLSLVDCTPEPCSITDAQLEFSNAINHIVEVQDFIFAPQQLNITLGDTVTFFWTGVVAHTTTSDATTGTDSWDSGLLGQGASYSVVPTQLGAHPYYCIPHGAPGGVGMAGIINVVPPCDNGNVNGLLTFQSGGGNASQYNVLIDGQTYAGSPFDYAANGNNSLLLTLAGDGLTHSISIADLDDPSCNQELNVELPDCTPACELTLTASAGDCDGNNEIPIQLTIQSANTTSNGFNLLVDGSPAAGSPYPYDGSGTTTITIHLEGDGLSHDFSITDLNDSDCTASATLSLVDCTPEPCSITDAQIEFSNAINHIVEVQDFVFAPQQLNVTLGDTVTFLWTGVVAHTTTSDATTGTDSWDSGLLGQGASYSVVPTQLGAHPYYCIPHGAPGGVGMAGTINVVPPCDNGNVNGLLTFQSGGGNASQYNVLIDGQTYAGSPFDYAANGNNSLLLTLAGDGLTHSISIVDVDDPTCSQELNVELPDCTPVCNLEILDITVSDCTANDSVEVAISIQGEHTSSTFNIYLDGTILLSNISYASSDTTNIQFTLPGNGLTFTVLLQDNETPDCSDQGTIVLPNCGESCIINDVSVNVINQRLHTVEVLDFEFAPKDITVNTGDTIRFIWTGVIPHTVTSDATSGAVVFNSGLLGQGAIYDLIIDEPGLHPYYCIPHGSPGGIGMAGTILVEEDCDDNKLGVRISFNAANGSQTGYNVLIDNLLEANSPFSYDLSGSNQIIVEVTADGQNHHIRLEDVLDGDCAFDTTIVMPNCSDPCFGLSSQFSYAQTNEALQLAFTDISSGAVDNWQWSFGDGQYSDEQNPIHQYAAAGTYEVCLIIGNSSLACTDTICQNITIEEYICRASFDMEVEGLMVHFTNTSVTNQSLTGIMWNFGDNFGASNIEDISHEYDSLGVYEVCLTIIADSCQNTICDTLDLSNPCLLFSPEFVFTNTDDELCVQLVDLTSGEPNQWLWGFGDGNTSNEQNPLHCYDKPGTYNICLLVQDTENGCNKSYCQEVDIQTTAIHELKPFNLSLVVYPNPAGIQQQEWTIEGIRTEDLHQSLTLKVYDLQGKTHNVGNLNAKQQMQLQLDQPLAAGVYIIELRSKAAIYRAKLIIQ